MFAPPKRRFHAWTLAVCLVVATGAFAQSDQPSASDALEAAVQLFEEGDYVGAQHALNQVNADGLDDDGRAALVEFTERARLAVAMFQKAESDLDAAGLALSEGRMDHARQLLRAIVDNQYAAKETGREARGELQKIDNAPEAAPPAASEDAADRAIAGEDDPDITRQRRSLRAKVLTREADKAAVAGRISEARRLYTKAIGLVPGLPEAAAGLERIEQQELVESDARALINRTRDRNAVKWQRTVATYREAEREVRDHVLNNRYEPARQTLLRARQLLDAGKSAADPVSRYEALLHDVQALTRYVEDEERRYNEREIVRQRQQAQREHSERRDRARSAKTRRINDLMTQAMQHRNDRDFDSSANVLKQVIAIDPANDAARWMLDIVEDRRAYALQRELADDISRQTQNVLIDVQNSRIPWWEDVTFPKNWLEIISRPTRRRPGTEPTGGIDPNLQSRLDQKIQIDFDGDPFDEVMERLADANNINIPVVWSDLAASSIAPDTPVHLKLQNPVPLRTALHEVLDQVGGAHELDFRASGGVVKVATRRWLDREVLEEVYDVRDLLTPIPNFTDAPSMNLLDPAVFHTPPQLAANRSVFGGRTAYSDEYGEEADRLSDEDADKLITLIRDTIEPESWRDRGGDVGSITEINGQFVVTQTPTGHARIGGLLSKLREQRAIQVALESRFITVQSNYLEEMGMDLDIVLNAGNAEFDFLENPDNRGNLLFDPIVGSRLLLPRSFSRFGFTPAVPTAGNTLTAGSTNGLVQPFNQPGLIPQRGNSGITAGNSTPVPLLNNILQFTDPGGLTSDLPGSFAGNPNLQPAFALFGSFLDNIQVDFLVRATQADSRTSLLTAPRLVLFNGQRAWVAVVNQQSFVSSLQPIVDATGQAPIVATIETGAVLDAQITVSADKRYVTMTLRPSVGRLLGIQTFAFQTGAAAGEGAFVQLPNISRQVLRTTVTVPDGGTLLTGGQKLAGEIEVESGVPILSKIPIFKRLYSSRTLVKDEQVLLILIKPKIIIQSEAEQEAFPTFSQN